MRPTVTYTPYTTSSKEQTGDVITFAQFEEGNVISETGNDTEGFAASSWEYHSIKKYTLCTYLVLER